MKVRLEDALRETLEELAAEARPASPLAGALWRAGQARARRVRITAATIAAAAITGVSSMVLAGGGGTVDPAPGTTSPPAPTSAWHTPSEPSATRFLGQTPELGSQPITLAGGWMFGAGPGDRGFWVWDRSRETYRQVPYDRVYPAPSGTFAVVEQRGGRAGVLDLRTDGVRWLDGLVMTDLPQWTADGTRFLTTRSATHVLIVDAATGDLHEIPGESSNWGAVPMFWTSDDRAVAVQIGNGTWQVRSPETGTVSGRITKLPPVGAANDISPDGRHALGDWSAIYAVVDTATGEPVGYPTAYIHPGRGYWVDNDRALLLIGEDKIVVMIDLSGREIGRFPLPAALREDESQTYTLIRM